MHGPIAGFGRFRAHASVRKVPQFSWPGVPGWRRRLALPVDWEFPWPTSPTPAGALRRCDVFQNFNRSQSPEFLNAAFIQDLLQAPPHLQHGIALQDLAQRPLGCLTQLLQILSGFAAFRKVLAMLRRRRTWQHLLCLGRREPAADAFLEKRHRSWLGTAPPTSTGLTGMPWRRPHCQVQ